MKRSFASLAVVVACLCACDDAPTSHQYLTLRFDADLACYEPSAALDTVPGGDGTLTCAPACLVAAQPGGGEIVYVSTMCGPYPDAITDTTGTDPACPAALAAWSNGCACGEDGGPACAPTGSDAGAADDSGNDEAATSDEGGAGDATLSDGAIDAPKD